MKLKVPPHLAVEEGGVPTHRYKQISIHVDHDGTADVPRWMVPDLLARGCTHCEGHHKAFDVRAELAAVPDSHSHELSIFLNAHGKKDHYFEAHKHHLSDGLRARGDTEVADELDNLYQQHHKLATKGRGRIVVMDTEERRAAALKLFDEMAKK
jgi:hypothetical protein